MDGREGVCQRPPEIQTKTQTHYFDPGPTVSGFEFSVCLENVKISRDPDTKDVFSLADGVNPYSATSYNLAFYLLKVVSRFRDPQVQEVQNDLHMHNLNQNVCKTSKINDNLSKLERLMTIYQN